MCTVIRYSRVHMTLIFLLLTFSFQVREVAPQKEWFTTQLLFKEMQNPNWEVIFKCVQCASRVLHVLKNASSQEVVSF